MLIEETTREASAQIRIKGKILAENITFEEFVVQAVFAETP